MTLLPRFKPDDLPAQVDRAVGQAIDHTVERTWHETPSWARGIPIIGPGISGATPGTDPAILAEQGYFD